MRPTLSPEMVAIVESVVPAKVQRLVVEVVHRTWLQEIRHGLACVGQIRTEGDGGVVVALGHGEADQHHPYLPRA